MGGAVHLTFPVGYWYDTSITFDGCSFGNSYAAPDGSGGALCIDTDMNAAVAFDVSVVRTDFFNNTTPGFSCPFPLPFGVPTMTRCVCVC